jgi:hypothetical protein
MFGDNCSRSSDVTWRSQPTGSRTPPVIKRSISSILPYHLLSKWPFSKRFPFRHSACISYLSHPSYMAMYFSWHHCPNNTRWPTYLLTYSLTHSLTQSVVQDIIWKADCHSACQQIFCFLMEPEGSLPCSHKPAIGPYPGPAESSSPHRSLSP